MFVMKLLTVLLLFINIVKSSDISNEAYEQIQNANRAGRRIYKHNHRQVESIPVAIVFDDDGGREAKLISPKDNGPNVHKENTSEKHLGQTESPTFIRLSSDFSVKSTELNTVKVKLPEPKIITKEDLQIPVAVIYETETTTSRNHKKVSRSRARSQGQPNRRRLQKVEQNISDHKSTTNQDNTNTTEKTNDVALTTDKVMEKKMTKNAEMNVKNTTVPRKNGERKPVVPIIQSENKVFGHNGAFHYSYEGGDGTRAFGRGELKSFEDDNAGEAVVGGFSYTDKDGQDFSLTFTADENGYRPVGAHLPTPPPIPPPIERALRYLATKTTPEPVTDSMLSKDIGE